MWDATVDGRKLNFRLWGINNQNFIMRDEETGSWWQQVTGEAILGPLKGRRLRPVMHDELTFATWKREQPGGRVLRPDARLAAKGNYPADWEEDVGRLPLVTAPGADEPFAPRDLVVGITVNGASKAYPFAALQKQSPVLDALGGTPLLIVVNDDGQSVRAFERIVDGRPLEFFAKPDAAGLLLVDSATGSEWDFTGTATSGPLKGKQLRRVPVLKDFWFDWKTYQPATAVYKLGDR